ncbi:MAG TPA: SDR family oxidoreductase, partial [Phycisphaerae bacterium]|nr:SDR family oxidoreductase [Phycisphaerae bacterium]
MAASNVESKTLPTASTIMIGAAIGVAALFAARAIVRARRRLELRGRKVVIIGGSRGLGLALAREFAERRARLVLCARDKQELEAAAADLAARGGNAAIFVCDGKDRDQVAATIAAIENDGPIDVLVNCAGTIIVGPLESMTLEDFRHTVDVNFWSAMHATFAALPGMRARRQGRIVNIGSVGGRLPAPHLAAYCASKYALVGMSEALGVELRNDGIFVTTVNPGLMRTGSPR